MAVELKVPEVGESVTEAVITRWLKSEGDRVEKDEPVAELETEKVDVELPAPVAGVLARITAEEGETVAVGDVIGVIEEEGEAREEEAAREEDEKREEAKKAAEEARREEETAAEEEREEPEREEEKEEREKTEKEEERERGEREEGEEERREEREKREEREGERARGQIEVRPRVMPAAGSALADHGLTAEEVEGTGPGGRVTKEDVERHVAERCREEAREERDEEREEEKEKEEAQEAAEKEQRRRGDREQETVPMTPIRKRIAKRLVEAQRTTATTTTFNEVDMTAVQELRHRYGERFEEKHEISLGLMSFFVKAVVDAVERYPKFNARIRDDSIVYHHYCDIGIAVATERGLVVPVIRNAESLGFAEIERSIARLARRARRGELEVDDLTGGTFTITNGGVFGSLLSTPLLNPPQTAALGMHAIQERPVAVEGEVRIRPMMYVALSYDHRLVDGAEAVTFLKRIKQVVEEPARLLLEP